MIKYFGIPVAMVFVFIAWAFFNVFVTVNFGDPAQEAGGSGPALGFNLLVALVIAIVWVIAVVAWDRRKK